MADWATPSLTTAYATFLSALSGRLDDSAKQFSSSLTTPTNQPTGTVRWNSTNNNWEIWSGTAWGVLTATYSISIAGNAATATTASAVPWSGITSKPTTLSGFGITDGITAATAAATYAPIASPALTGTATAADTGGTQQTLGWRGVPQNSQVANYTLGLVDQGKHVLMNGTSLLLTIPTNASVAFPIGTAITIVNGNATSLSIACADTLTKAASTTTGTRTLAQNGIATIVKTGTTSWLISGTGLT